MHWLLLLCVLLAWDSGNANVPRKRVGELSHFHDYLQGVPRSRQKRQTSHPGCSGTELVIDSVGEITSPNFPGVYPNNANCRWMIRNPSGQGIALHFTAFSLEAAASCVYDRLTIAHSPDSNATTRVFCGSSRPADIHSSGQYIHITFRTDESVTSSGFKLQFRFNGPSSRTEVDDACPTLKQLRSPGVITSPNFPLTYPDNSLCRWQITTPDGYDGILVMFETFNIQNHPSCGYDSLEINHQFAQRTMFCGSARPDNIIAPGRQMSITFRTDGSVGRSGFKLDFRFVTFPLKPDACLNYVLGLRGHGTITSPNFPSAYPNNALCQWRINVPIGKRVSLTIDEFNLVRDSTCALDSLKIYDGRSDGQTLLANWCGNSIPQQLESSGHTMYLKFKSDGSGVASGFKIRFNFTTDPTGGDRGLCTGSITSDTQPLISPDYPDNYPDNVLCEWLIIAPIGQFITLRSLAPGDFQLEDTVGCISDNVTIYDLNLQENQVIGRFCGDYFRTVHSSGHKMRVVFRSDISGAFRGFQLDIEFTTSMIDTTMSPLPTAMPPGPRSTPPGPTGMPPGRRPTTPGRTPMPPGPTAMPPGPTAMPPGPRPTPPGPRPMPPGPTTEGCGGSLGGDFGHLESPGFGLSNYPPNVECIWKIVVPLGRIIVLEINSLTLQYEANCIHDALTVYDSWMVNDNKLGTFCGTKHVAVLSVQSTGNFLTVQFVSDGTMQSEGFSATYRTVLQVISSTMSACGSSRPALLVLRSEGETGVISSPVQRANSDSYPTNAFCQWQIIVPRGKRVNLHVNWFSIEDDSRCQSDNLTIFDGPTTHANLIGRYCGSNILPNIVATGNFMMIQFATDFFVQNGGFSLTYSVATTTRNESSCGIPEVSGISRPIAAEAPRYSWPWETGILYDNRFICGGSIISKRWVLTAAHCVSQLSDPTKYGIMVGMYDFMNPDMMVQLVGVVAIVVHEAYDNRTMRNDIALIQLNADILYTAATKPVCLQSSDVSPGTTCYSTGWGFISGWGFNTGIPQRLLQVPLPILDRATCSSASFSGSRFTETMICSGYAQGDRTVCQDDPGGLLVCLSDGTFSLHGITPQGMGCGHASSLRIFTRVAGYVSWIERWTHGAP